MPDTTQQNAEHPQAPRHNEPPKVIYTTHPKVVVGVVIIAILMLFNLIFSVVLGLTLYISPPDSTLDSYFSLDRLAVAGVVSAILTWFIWAVIDGEIS